MNAAGANKVPVQPGTKKIILKCIPGNNGMLVSGIQNAGTGISLNSSIIKPKGDGELLSSQSKTPSIVYVLNKKPSLPSTSSSLLVPSSKSGSVDYSSRSAVKSSFNSIPDCDSNTLDRGVTKTSSDFGGNIGGTKNENSRNHHNDGAGLLTSTEQQKTVTSRPIIVGVYDSVVGDGEVEETYENGHKDKDNELECAKIDITLRNVVCAFNTRCHLNLREITQNGVNVIFKSAQNLLEMKLRNPKCTAFLFSSGKITCTGCTSEENARLAAKKIAYYLKRLGYAVKFCSYRVVNVMATCAMPFTIRLAEFTSSNEKISSYEPEINPGVTCKFAGIKASLKIFTSGKITVTAPSASAAEQAVQMVYPLVYEHKREDIIPDSYNYGMEEEYEDFDEEYDGDSDSDYNF